MFPDDYLEARGIIDASRFTMHLDEHLDRFGEGLMGVAFGTSNVRCSHDELTAQGIDAGDIRRLTRNFEHPEGWTQPSFELFAPAADDIEGLMHVVVLQHLTPELIRRADFLTHANGCIGVNEIVGTVYDVSRCADKMERLLGNDAVTRSEEGVLLSLASGQSISLLVPDSYLREFGAIAESPQPDTPRLGAMTLRVASLTATATLLQNNGVAFTKPSDGRIRIAPADACGAILQFTESSLG